MALITTIALLSCHLHVWCLVSSGKIDEIYYLQSYQEGWTDGKWEEKMDERKCIERNSFVQVNDLGILYIYLGSIIMLYRLSSQFI